MRVTSSSFPIPIRIPVCRRGAGRRAAATAVDAGSLRVRHPGPLSSQPHEPEGRQQDVAATRRSRHPLQAATRELRSRTSAPFRRRVVRPERPAAHLGNPTELPSRSRPTRCSCTVGGHWSARVPLKAAQRGTPTGYRSAADTVRHLPLSGHRRRAAGRSQGLNGPALCWLSRRAIYLSLAGFAVMLGLLGLPLRSPVRVLLVVVPLGRCRHCRHCSARNWPAVN